MNGILLINKPKNMTSRDVVNIVSNVLNRKKIGHSGTLDPIATGVLVLGVGKGTKIIELLTNYDKEYVAEVILGIETDTLDITGKIINKNIPNITKEQVLNILNSFIGEYDMEVPFYSAIKVRGKKLYEYARNGEDVIIPRRKVNIYDLKLISDLIYEENTIKFKIKCKVSKGTYIRSLIRDIGRKLGTYGTMASLIRTKQGNFNIEDCYSIEDIKNNNFKLLSIIDVLDIPSIKVDKELEFKIRNGAIIDKFFKEDKVLIIDNDNNPIAIYQIYTKDNTKVKPYKIFL
jgi:tRNA pseudouridine55 synthase